MLNWLFRELCSLTLTHKITKGGISIAKGGTLIAKGGTLIAKGGTFIEKPYNSQMYDKN